MARKSNEIKIIWHEPAEKQTSENVQQAVDDLYIKIIIDKLAPAGLHMMSRKLH